MAKTLKEYYVEFRKGHNPITGEQNLYKNITDEMIWNAATKAAEEKFKSPNKTKPPLCSCGERAVHVLCDNCYCDKVFENNKA